MKLFLLCIFLLIGFISLAQSPKANIIIEAVTSVHFVSSRQSTEQGDQGMYYELRTGYTRSSFFEFSLNTSFQKRSYIYFAKESNGSLVPLFMSRYYVPVGIHSRINLTDFFRKQVPILKPNTPVDFYLQLGVLYLLGKDDRDDREEEFRRAGAYVPYYFYPFIEEYNQPYLTYMAGVRYNFNHRFGLFVEGGEGALMTVQLGLRKLF